MEDNSENGSETIDIQFSAAPKSTISVFFEPLGGEYRLTDGETVFFRIPRRLIGSVEYVVWPDGLSVWLTYDKDEQADFIVLDQNMEELDRF